MSDDQSNEITKLRASVAALSKAVLRHYGTMTALEASLYAMIESHPNPQLLQKHLDEGLERIHAVFLAGSQDEAGLAAFQETQQRLTDSCRRVQTELRPGK